MTEFLIAKEIETDLRIIISEAQQRKTIPHIKERAERAVSSMLTITDRTGLDNSIEEILSTLLIATEIGTAPKIIMLSLNVLQKLAASKVIHSDTFLHIVTVLCKAASSVTSVLSMNASSAPPVNEVELAQIRCLQTLHLLQVEELAPYFLDEVALSQIISMCSNLVNNSVCSPIVIQTASAAISQLQLFVSEITEKLLVSSPDVDEIGDLAVLNSQGELNGVASAIKTDSLGSAKALFFLIHDLVTMSSPSLTRSVFCNLFGSSRLRPQLSVEILSHIFESSSGFWNKHTAFVQLINVYLLPIMAKTLSSGEVKIHELRMFLKLFARMSNNKVLFKLCSKEMNKVFIQLNNEILDDRLDHIKRIILTETITLAICSNKDVVFSDLESPILSTRSPFGGDSPVRFGKSSTVTISESIIESICLFVHHSCSLDSVGLLSFFAELHRLGLRTINDSTSGQSFSILNNPSMSTESFSVGNLEVVGVSIEMILVYIDTTFKQTQQPTYPIHSTWMSLLSCLLMVASNTPDPMTSIPGVLVGMEKLLFVLCRDNLKEGVNSVIYSIIKVKYMNKFLLNLFHRISNDLVCLKAVPVPLWRSIIRYFESIPSLSQPEESAMDAFFASCSSVETVKILVEALITPEHATSWVFIRLSQLLTSEFGVASIQSVWIPIITPFLQPNASWPKPVVSSAIEMISKVAIVSVHHNPGIQPDILKSLREFVTISEPDVSQRLLEIVESSGHLQTQSSWTIIVEILLNAKSLKFKIAELIIEEFLFLDKIDLSFVIHALVQACLETTSLPITCAFKATGLVQRIAESDNGLLWDSIVDFFDLAIRDGRSEVRNCAIRTMNSIDKFDSSTVLKIARHLLSSRKDDSSTTIDPSIILHHSRDTEEKRWNESIVLMTRNVTHFVTKSVPEDTYELEEWLLFGFKYQSNDHGSIVEISQAFVKSFVDLVRIKGIETVADSIIETVKERVLNEPQLPVVASILVPQILPLANLNGKIFGLFAATITHPNLYLGSSIPYPAQHARGIGEHDEPLWYRSGWEKPYMREVEAFKSAIDDPIKTDQLFASILGSISINLDPLGLIELTLGPVNTFRNSYTLALGIRVIDVVVEHYPVLPESVQRALVSALTVLGCTRNESVAIAASNVWKFSCRKLNEVSQKDLFLKEAMVAIITSTEYTTRPIDTVDYLMIDTVMNLPGIDQWIDSVVLPTLCDEANRGDETLNDVYMYVLDQILKLKKIKLHQFAMNRVVKALFKQHNIYSSSIVMVLRQLTEIIEDEGVANLVTAAWTELTETLLLCENIEIRRNLSLLLSKFRVHIS